MLDLLPDDVLFSHIIPKSTFEIKTWSQLKLTCKTLYTKIQIPIPKDFKYSIIVLITDVYKVVAICNSIKSSIRCFESVKEGSIQIYSDVLLEEDEPSEISLTSILCHRTPTSCKITHDKNTYLKDGRWKRVPLNSVLK